MMETAAAIPSESRNATSCTGYSWKKYGHKVLASVNVKRFYYACAQKDTHGCPAKKIVDKPRKRPRAGSLNGRAASSGGGSDGGGGGDGGCAGGGALSPEASTTSDNRKPVSPNAAGRLNLLASVSRNDKLSGSSPQDFWARSSFPGPAGAVACAGHDQGSAGEAMAAAAGSDSAAGGELSTETAMKEKTWFENAHNHPPPLLSSRLSRNRFLAAASATPAAAAAAVPPPSPPPQGGVMMVPAASAAGGGVWRQQEQQQQIMLHQQQQQQQQFLVQQQTPKLRTGRNGGQAEPHLATFPAPGNNTQALSVRSPPPHQQAQLQSQQQQLMMGRPMMPLDQSSLNCSGRQDASGGVSITLGVTSSVPCGGNAAYHPCGEAHHALRSTPPQQHCTEASQWPGSHPRRQGYLKTAEGSGENRMPLLQMLSNQEPPPQLLLCTEPPLTPWDSGQPGNHASSPHSLPQHGLSGQPQQHQQQQQQQQKQQQQNDSQHQPQQQSQQWQQGQQRIQYAGQFNQPVSASLPPLPPSPHTSTPPTPLPISAPAMRPAMYAVPSAHANLAPTAERSTVGGNSESNGTTGLCLSSNVCDGSTWEQPSHPGKRLKRDPGSSASLITALGSRLPMPSNVLTHSNSNAPAPALAPALALATAIAAAAAAAAAPAPAARDKATTPAEAQPMERNFIDALSLSPSSLSLACSLAPPHGPKGESHTGEGAKAGGFVGKVRMGKNVKGESLMGEVVLGEGCSPSARGPSLDLPGFYEPSFPELSLSLGRL